MPTPMEMGTARTGGSVPTVRPMVPDATSPDVSVTLRVPGAAPVPSPAGQRDRTPAPQGPRMAKATPPKAILPEGAPLTGDGPGEPVIVFVDPTGKPDKNGKLPARVVRVRPPAAQRLPVDKSHRVTAGESLQTVARKYGVTPKSLMVANGLPGEGALRSGSIIRVPGTFDVVMNDRRVAFDVSPRVENGMALAPFRQIFEHAGGVVVWYPETQEVRAAKDQTEVKVRIGSKEARVNQVLVVMDREAFLDSGRTIVPVSFMEKALDLKAEYDVKNGTIVLVRR